MRANTMTKDQDEPSMEDILSSIRQIISEDDSGTQTPANTDTPRKELQSDREIIDLIHQLQEDGTVEQVKPFSGQNKAQEEETVMADETTEVSADDLITDAMEDDADSDTSSDEVIDLEGDDDDGGESDESKRSDNEGDVMTESSEISKSGDEDLMSETALSEAASALDSLSRITSTSKDKNKASGLGDKTVEELVKDVLRPILKDWLDANLPSYVRAIVTEQVEKVIRENNKKAS